MPNDPNFIPAPESYNADTHYPSGKPRPGQLQSMKNWHLMIIDYVLLNPAATQQEIGDHFGYTRETVNLVMNSDLFQAKLEERREEFRAKVDGTAIDRLEGKIAGLAEDSVDLLRDKIQQERAIIGLDATRETAEMALKALGYGAPKISKTVNNNTQVVVVSKDDLARARERIIGPAALPSPEGK